MNFHQWNDAFSFFSHSILQDHVDYVLGHFVSEIHAEMPIAGQARQLKAGEIANLLEYIKGISKQRMTCKTIKSKISSECNLKHVLLVDIKKHSLKLITIWN